MNFSTKKKDALYNAVYEEIMQARIKIARLLKGVKPQDIEVDNILSDLMMNRLKRR